MVAKGGGFEEVGVEVSGGSGVVELGDPPGFVLFEGEVGVEAGLVVHVGGVAEEEVGVDVDVVGVGVELFEGVHFAVVGLGVAGVLLDRVVRSLDRLSVLLHFEVAEADVGVGDLLVCGGVLVDVELVAADGIFVVARPEKLVAPILQRHLL